MKVYCPVCKEYKHPDEFHHDSSRPSGLKWLCIGCAKKKRWQQKPPKKFIKKWKTDAELKGLGFAIPPAETEKLKGPQQFVLPTPLSKAVLIHARRHRGKNAGLYPTKADAEDLWSIAWGRIAESTSADTNELLREADRALDAARKRGERREDVMRNVYYYEDLAPSEEDGSGLEVLERIQLEKEMGKTKSHPNQDGGTYGYDEENE